MGPRAFPFLFFSPPLPFSFLSFPLLLLSLLFFLSLLLFLEVGPVTRKIQLGSLGSLPHWDHPSRNRILYNYFLKYEI